MSRTWTMTYVVVQAGVRYVCRIRDGRVRLTRAASLAPAGEFFERRRV